jgi:hypothetical protein
MWPGVGRQELRSLPYSGRGRRLEGVGNRPRVSYLPGPALDRVLKGVKSGQLA